MAFRAFIAPFPPMMTPEMLRVPDALFTWSFISAPFSVLS